MNAYKKWLEDQKQQETIENEGFFLKLDAGKAHRKTHFSQNDYLIAARKHAKTDHFLKQYKQI